MTEAAKAITKAFYGRNPRYSYLTGCSTGGHQGLAEAQRFPKDYDGILAGAPGNNATHLHTAHMWTWNAANQSPASAIPVSKLPMLANAAPRPAMLDGVPIADYHPATLPLRSRHYSCSGRRPQRLTLPG
jgi:hypothetical protein